MRRGCSLRRSVFSFTLNHYQLEVILIKVIYNEDNTLYRMYKDAKAIKRFYAFRKLAYSFYLLTFYSACFVTGRLLFQFVNGQLKMNVLAGTILLYLASILSYHISQLNPSESNELLTPDILYDRSLNVDSTLHISYEDLGDTYSVSFILEDRERNETVSCTRVMPCVKTSDVSEETIDLENNIFYIPM